MQLNVCLSRSSIYFSLLHRDCLNFSLLWQPRLIQFMEDEQHQTPGMAHLHSQILHCLNRLHNWAAENVKRCSDTFQIIAGQLRANPMVTCNVCQLFVQEWNIWCNNAILYVNTSYRTAFHRMSTQLGANTNTPTFNESLLSHYNANNSLRIELVMRWCQVYCGQNVSVILQILC